MKNALSAASPAGIGALEIKRAYQRNMFFSVILSAGTALIMMSGLLLHAALQPPPTVPSVIKVFEQPNFMTPITPMTSRTVTKLAKTRLRMPEFGIPVPVDDCFVDDSIVFGTIDELADYLNMPGGGIGEGDGSESLIYEPPPVVLPESDILEFAEHMPIPVDIETPAYPEIAERAGIEGRVWVKVLVDQNGFVRRALIAKASGTSAGFEEAAIAAAMHNRYRPALQNGRAMMVWPTYKVDFVLR